MYSKIPESMRLFTNRITAMKFYQQVNKLTIIYQCA